MKVISLNIWGGHLYEPLMKFVAQNKDSTDIFCFQEIFDSPRKDITESHEYHVHVLEELAAALPDFNHVYYPIQNGMDFKEPIDFELSTGQATFVKKTLPILSSGEIFTYLERDQATVGPNGSEMFPSNLVYTRVPYKNDALTVVNFHGFAFVGDDKLDNPDRIEQSRKLKDFVSRETNPVVLVGDFNLLPQTQSITMLEDELVNLIKKYKVVTTRSKASTWYGKPDWQAFADYTFVSPTIAINNFEVPDVQVSDHLPMVLEFE